MRDWLERATRTPAREALRGPADWWLLLQVLSVATLVPLLARLPLPRLMRLFDAPARRRADPERAARAATFVRGYLRRRSRHPNPCLVRSLTLFHFLRREGVRVDIHFGIEPATRKGHAWISHVGEPLLEPEDPTKRYLEMYRYPGTAVVAEAAT